MVTKAMGGIASNRDHPDTVCPGGVHTHATGVAAINRSNKGRRFNGRCASIPTHTNRGR